MTETEKETADGQRFLVGTAIGEPTTPPPVVVMNRMTDLKKRGALRSS